MKRLFEKRHISDTSVVYLGTYELVDWGYVKGISHSFS